MRAPAWINIDDRQYRTMHQTMPVAPSGGCDEQLE
jgi:hypothetical protein